MSTLTKILSLTAGSLLALSAVSCQKHGVCDDVSGSCLTLHVEGDRSYDSLRTALDLIADVSQQRLGDTPGGSDGIQLPMTLRVVPPSDVAASAVIGVEVAGMRGDAVAATAKSDPGFSWPDGTHQELTLHLTESTDGLDGGVGDDGGGGDMAMPPGDMPPPGDMTMPPIDLKWRTETNNARAPLYAVWAGTGQAYTVGENGTILSRQTDGTWRADPAGTNVTLNGVTGISGTSIFVVGAAPGSWRRDTMRWNADANGLNLGMGGELLSLTPGATAGELWAGDRDGHVWHRTGPAGGSGTWQTPEQVFPAGQRVYGVSVAGGAIFAVGDTGRVAVRQDGAPGTAWKTYQYPALPTGDPFTLNAVWAFDKNTAVAVGAGGLLVRYSAGTWQTSPQSVDAAKTELFGVWGLREDRVWAVGDTGLIIRVEGTRATQLARSNPQSLYAIFGRSETDIFIVGEAMGGSSLILHGTP